MDVIIRLAKTNPAISVVQAQGFSLFAEMLGPSNYDSCPFVFIRGFRTHSYGLDSNRGFDAGVGIVADQLEILEFEFVNILHRWIQLHFWQLAGFAGEL